MSLKEILDRDFYNKPNPTKIPDSEYYAIEEKWWYPEVTEIVIDPQIMKKLTTKYNRPEGIVLHHTAGLGMHGLENWFKQSNLSCQFLVSRIGEVVQMAPCNFICTHAGGIWPMDKPRYMNVNLAFVGIEFENLGQLKKKGDKYYNWNGTQEYKGPVRERHILGEKYWQPATPVQEEKGYALIKWLLSRWEINTGNLIGHSECVKTGKVDPAGLFSIGGMVDVRSDFRQMGFK